MSREPPPTDRWVICAKDHLHWGELGGAGLLLRYVPRNGEPTYLLQQRSRWVDEGGTWAPPGGAIHDGESPEEAARREASEEIWPVPAYKVSAVDVQDCGGGWNFHIVVAEIERPFLAYRAAETDATGWFTLADMGMLALHPGFKRWVEQHLPTHPRRWR